MSQGSARKDSLLVILKVHGTGVQLRHHDGVQIKQSQQSYKLYCHDLESRQSTHVRVFSLNGCDPKSEGGLFKQQQPSGEPLDSDDLVIFMGNPIGSIQKASYALDIGVVLPLSNSLEDLSEERFSKIGTAYLYVDPKFSTQGIQRLQVVGTKSMAPIGQLQVEYLIVKSPAAYGVPVPRPKWLSRINQLDAGHRGSGSGCRADLQGGITENTIASFNYAARHGADMCELDVMCTSDGVPVIYHNYTLDKSRPDATQIDQITLNELRKLGSILHDNNCSHNKDSPQEAPQGSSRPFPTLAEVLQDVDKTCALNIELKWPQMFHNGKTEAVQYREINDFVDRILDVIYQHANGRAILLSTFHADVAILLRLKQSVYPVLFLTTGDSQHFNDPTTKTVKNAIHFAKAFDMAGINPNAAHLTASLVRYAQDRGLLVYAWGKIETSQAVKELRQTGLNGVIYDKIDLIKPQD